MLRDICCYFVLHITLYLVWFACMDTPNPWHCHFSENWVHPWDHQSMNSWHINAFWPMAVLGYNRGGNADQLTHQTHGCIARIVRSFLCGQLNLLFYVLSDVHLTMTSAMRLLVSLPQIRTFQINAEKGANYTPLNTISYRHQQLIFFVKFRWLQNSFSPKSLPK